jgi:hypothetical protein
VRVAEMAPHPGQRVAVGGVGRHDEELVVVQHRDSQVSL